MAMFVSESINIFNRMLGLIRVLEGSVLGTVPLTAILCLLEVTIAYWAAEEHYA